MAYQPTNPHPYMETIDATKDNQFSCQISDRDIVTGATINIFNELGELSNYVEDLKSVFVFTSGYLSISDPIQDDKTTIRLKLKEYMNNGYTLGVIDDKGNLCKITKVSRSAPSTTYIYVKGSFTKDNDYKVYSDVPIEVVVPEEKLSTSKPIYGGNLDTSVFSYSVEPDKLQNGVDYSWNVVFNLTEEKYISSGKVNKMNADYTSVYIPYSTSSFERLNNCDLNHVYISLYNPQKHLTVDLKLDPEKDVDATSDAMLVVYIETLDEEQKDDLGILDTSVENFGSHLSYRIYEGDITLTTPKYHFKTRQTPELIFDDVPSEIHSDEYTFRANYYQNDGTQFAYYQFDLYQNDELIDSSDQQNSRLIQYTFHGLMNQADYRLVLTVVDDDGVETIAEHLFTVDYNLLQSTITPKTEVDNFNGCIKVDYSNHMAIPGKPSDENSIDFKKSYGISISDNTSLLWDEMGSKPLNIPASSYQVIRWHGKRGFNGTIIDVYDAEFPWNATSISFDGNKFVAKQRRGTEVFEEPYSIYNDEASAIAGFDEYSVLYTKNSYNGGIVIELDGTRKGNMIIKSGQWIQVGNEHRKITKVNDNTITIDRKLGEAEEHIDVVIYKEDCRYVLEDTNESNSSPESGVLGDDDILIDNDQVSKYWWLIVIYPPSNEKIVEIHKSQIFTEESEG